MDEIILSRTTLDKVALLTCLQNATRIFIVHKAEEGGPAVQGVKIEPPAEGDGSELA